MSNTHATARQKLGKWGETVAATYLEANGYTILARNWRCQWGEIDIIVQQNKLLAFVEVRTRRGRALGTPEQSITPRKLDKLVKTAQTYLSQHDLETEWRLDLVAVELDNQGKLLRCDHLPNMLPAW